MGHPGTGRRDEHGRWRFGWRLIAMAAVAAALLEAAPAQEPPDARAEQAPPADEVDGTLLALVMQLDDPAFDRRERAEDALLEVPFDRRQFYAILQHMELTAEQRYRLLGVFSRRLVNQPRGALGISINTRRRDGVIEIEAFVEDLPAREVLEVHDQITHLNGTPVVSWDRFVDTIQSMKPGDLISLQVQRPVRNDDGTLRVDDQGELDFETVNVQMRLGSAEKLSRDGQLAPSGIQQQREQEAYQAWLAYSPAFRELRLRRR